MNERRPLRTNSFGKSRRLSSASDYQRVLQFADSVFRQGPLRISNRSTKKGFARLGMIVPKRIARCSVQRNAIKRIIREWFRCSSSSLGSLDVVVALRSMPVQSSSIPSSIRRSLHEWEKDMKKGDVEL